MRLKNKSKSRALVCLAALGFLAAGCATPPPPEDKEGLAEYNQINDPLGAPGKLKLIENEENLFDGGLYLGIAGTATALVLQVLGLIDANLLAAYSSNLFGIVCVALVKIRHVRPYKRRLILETLQGVTA